MKNLFALTILFFSFIDLSAQDTLVKINNARVLVKVVEINPKSVKYKNFSNIDGPDIIIDRKQQKSK